MNWLHFIFGVAVGMASLAVISLLCIAATRNDAKAQRESNARVEEFLKDSNGWREQSADALTKIATILAQRSKHPGEMTS